MGPGSLLQRQFRPAANKVCINTPGELVDNGESAEDCSVRKLKEETGDAGKVIAG